MDMSIQRHCCFSEIKLDFDEEKQLHGYWESIFENSDLTIQIPDIIKRMIGKGISMSMRRIK